MPISVKDKHSEKPMTTTPVIQKMMPTVSLDAGDLPEIKDWKVGGKYKLELEVEQVSASKDDYMMEGDKKHPMTARFRIIKVNTSSGKGPITEQLKEKGKKVERLKEKAGEY